MSEESKRPSLRRKNPTSRRRGRKWDDGQVQRLEPGEDGVLVLCGDARIVSATRRKDNPGEVLLTGPGQPATGRRTLPDASIRAGCAAHGSHQVDLRKVWEQLELGAGRPGWRRVTLDRVSSV